jgi:hypothetical protein
MYEHCRLKSYIFPDAGGFRAKGVMTNSARRKRNEQSTWSLFRKIKLCMKKNLPSAYRVIESVKMQGNEVAIKKQSW